jgi:hypothetical protein
VFFTSAAILKMKKSTAPVTEMLSTKAVADRKRYVASMQISTEKKNFFS